MLYYIIYGAAYIIVYVFGQLNKNVGSQLLDHTYRVAYIEEYICTLSFSRVV